VGCTFDHTDRFAGTQRGRHQMLEPGMTAVAGVEHTAGRPSWDCRACGKPWPCDPARESLLSEMDRSSLAIYMWANLEEAVGNLPGGPPGELFDRFIHWTR
jgi:hypothetical protein